MRKSGSNEGNGKNSPSQLIDARIEELSDWRGETLARLRSLIKEADPEMVEEWKWRGVPAVIPSNRNGKRPNPHDPNLYAARNIVERFFCRMRDMRRLATRFEKTAANFRSMLYLFAARCWAN